MRVLIMFILIIMFLNPVYADQCMGNCTNGQGFMLYYDGSNYMGTWKNGQPDGKGIVTLPNGTLLYSGELKNGKPHGQGTMIINYTKYTGLFKNGKYMGKR